MAFFIAGALACQSHVFAQLSTTPEPDSSRWRSNYEDLSLACSARKVSVIDMKSQSGIHAKNETSFASPPRKASTESFRRPGGKPRSLENDSTEQEGSMAASQLKKKSRLWTRRLPRSRSLRSAAFLEPYMVPCLAGGTSFAMLRALAPAA